MPSDEEIKEMQEKIKNMSPEELAAFQKENCIFCHIIAGKVNSRKIYEDDKVIAVLDINPANPGHTLVIPKPHYAILPLIPEDIIQHLFKISQQISQNILKSLGAEGTTVFAANGAVAGQKAQHAMIHIIPRMTQDNIPLNIPSNKVSETELSNIQEKLSRKIYDILKLPYPQEEGTDEEDDEQEEKNEPPKKSKEEPKEAVSLDDIAKFITGKK